MKKGKITFPNYPVKDEHRTHYVRKPVEKDGVWKTADIVDNGYIDPFQEYMFYTPFPNEQECQHACDVHNKWLGFDEGDVNMIIGQSMGIHV